MKPTDDDVLATLARPAIRSLIKACDWVSDESLYRLAGAAEAQRPSDDDPTDGSPILRLVGGAA